MEATVLSVGKAALSGAISYAKSSLAEEAALQLGVRSDQAFITDELEMMQGFLLSAHDEEGGRSMVVKIWVKQVRDVAYDVEDSLMDFAVRLEQQSWWRIPRTVLDRRRVAKEMKLLRSKVEDISQRNVRYRLIKESSAAGSSGTAGQPSSSATISSEVVLHIAEATTRAALLQERKKVDLAKLIAEDADNLGSVIAVWGASSNVGVTSIIRDAYDDQQVKDKFQCRAWVRLVHPFNPNDLFVSLVRQFYQDSLEKTGKASTQEGGTATGLTVLTKMAALNSLVDEFNRYVTEKRYLVVIADLSTIEEWDWIKTYFPSMNKSRIIVSTKQFEVARLCPRQPYTVSEVEQKWSFDKDLYVFYHKVEAGTKGGDKLESSSNAEIHSADKPASEEQRTDGGHPTRASTVAAALEEDRIIDRMAAKAKVLQLLGQPGEVITICGMGGLGKTTLVTSLYQQELSERFERQAFLTVSRYQNLLEFHGDLLWQLRETEKSDGGELQRDKEKKSQTMETPTSQVDALAKILLEHKCLIVLDDLWSIAEWKSIMQRLPGLRNPANRIIVTTRELNVARCCSEEENIYSLELLNEEDALRLFATKVFKDINERERYSHLPDLIEQANLVLKKCGGLPLAISTIGSYLATKPRSAIEWRSLNKHINAELEMNPELGMIKIVLVSSYDGLPYHLKSCFLYLAIFPEDHRIRWGRLVKRWIAEGYSRRIREKTAVETGNSYITELINRNMVRPLKGGVSAVAGVRMGFLDVHDLIRDIGISKATEENLVFTLEEGCDLSTQGKIRHLAVSSSWTRDKDAFESALDLSHLRSLTVFGELEAFFISDKMRLLRVLDLEDTKGLTEQHLHQIGKLVHLNYLSLRRCYENNLRLPDSLGNLRHLQTLDARGICMVKLPRTITKLAKLRYLHVGFVPQYEDKGRTKFRYDRMSDWIIRKSWYTIIEPCLNCYGLYCTLCLVIGLLLVLLPVLLLVALICLLANLVHVLYVHMREGWTGDHVFYKQISPPGAIFPRGTRKLKSLHTVGIINIDGGNAILKELQDLTELRKLRVTGLNKKNCKDFCSVIAKHKRLESLFVRSEGEPGLSGYLDDLSEPPNNLQSLKLYGELSKLPEWIGKLTNLVKMELRSSWLREEEVCATLQVLGKLPNLAILRLQSFSFFADELCFSFHQEAFPSLKVLALVLPSNMKSVKFEGATDTNKLALLQVEFHWIPSGKPAVFSGLPSLLSLKEVVVRRASEDLREELRAELDKNPNNPILKL